MAAMHRARGVMKVKRRKTDSVTGKAKAMNQGVLDHPTLFTAPNPTVSVIQNQVTVVDQAEVLARTRVRGAAKARNVQLGILVGMLETRVLYVQGIADTSPTPEQAAATIEA